MNSTTSTSSVLDLNAQAISCLALGDHRGCAFQLEHALNAYRASSFQGSRDHSRQNHPAAHCQVQSVPLALPSCQRSVSQYGSSVLTVFQKAFVLTSNRQTLAAHETVVPAILLFNMGLSFHLEAIGNGQGKVMARAYEFYRYAMSLLERGPMQPRQLVAAIANNMAHVSACFYHDANLRIAMTIIKNLIDDPNTEMEVDEEDLDTLTMNWVFYAEYHHIKLAAAA